MDRWDQAKDMMQHASASLASDSTADLGAFSAAGRSSTDVGDLKLAVKEKKEDDPPPKDGDKDDTGDDGEQVLVESPGCSQRCGGNGNCKRKKSEPKLWFARSEKIMTELGNHRSWMKHTY